MADLTVSKTILLQLGGRKFIMLTGAFDLLGGDNFLQFRLKSAENNKNGINRVRITLTPQDTYTVEFYAGRGLDIKKVSEFDDIYCDGLQDLFEQQTGLLVTFHPRV